MYVTIDEVYSTAGITATEIARESVKGFILDAEERLDRFTNTTYWNVEDKGTVSSAGTNTLIDTTKTWTNNLFNDEDFVWVYSGTGSNQANKISSVSDSTITLENDWVTALDTTSKYRIIHSGKDPYRDITVDGNGEIAFHTPNYPLQILDAVTIADTSVTTSNIYQYKDSGRLLMSQSSEVRYWSNTYPQQVNIKYWYGVYPFPREAKRLITVYAALSTLEAQMGGTHNIPSTYSLPEGSVTIGQAYINIRGTFDVLTKEKDLLEQKIIVYTSFA